MNILCSVFVRIVTKDTKTKDNRELFFPSLETKFFFSSFWKSETRRTTTTKSQRPPFPMSPCCLRLSPQLCVCRRSSDRPRRSGSTP